MKDVSELLAKHLKTLERPFSRDWLTDFFSFMRFLQANSLIRLVFVSIQAAHEILEILLELHCKGKTIFLATHDVKVAAKTERVLYILDGTIVSTCHLGKCTSSAGGGRDREKKLSKWLESIEF